MSELTFLTPIPWETRNLGRPSYAVNVPAGRTLDEAVLRRDLSAAGASGPMFVQAKVDKADFAILAVLQRCHFYFAEVALAPFVVLAECEPLRKFIADPAAFAPPRRSVDELTVASLRPDDATEIAALETIAGESLTDDRFHLDPMCPKELADRRYVFWVRDLLADLTVSFDIIRVEDTVAGFMARRPEELILAGFARQFVRTGLGEFFWLSVLDRMRQAGETRVKTGISASNTAILNLYARLGFRFKFPTAVLHRWT